LNKVKKITECICVLCGKLKVAPHEDPRLADAVRFIRDPKKRLAVVHALVKAKMSCDMDTVDEEQQQKIANGEDVPRGHGGCGHDQPVLRKEGLKLFLVYGRGKDEVSDSTPTLVALANSYPFLRSPRTVTRNNLIENLSRQLKLTLSSAKSPMKISTFSVSQQLKRTQRG
jgi:hypothetical protein